MTTLNPYLNFNGNAEEAFNLYKSVFGGEFDNFNRMKDMPQTDGCGELSETDKEKVMHVSLPIGNGLVLMGSDMPESYADKFALGNNISISINTDSKEETEKLFNGLSNGGTITMPLGDTFWGAYFGMFTDKFGINWMVNYDYNRQK